MKRSITIVVLVLIIVGGGYLYLKSVTSPNAASTSNVQPPSSIGGDVNVCIGSAEYCQGIANMKNQAVQNANDQYILMLTAQAPTSVPTQSPEDHAMHQKQDKAMIDVLVTALWSLLILGCLGGLAFLAFQIYWHFRVKIPKDEVAPDIKQKDGLIVARLPGDPNHANVQDQFIVVDERSWGTLLIHIANGVATPIRVTDEVGKYLAVGHAMEAAESRGHAQQVMRALLQDWTGATTAQISALGSAASDWRAAGAKKDNDKAASSKKPVKRSMTRRQDGGNK